MRGAHYFVKNGGKAMLILAVMLFAVSGERLRRLLDPASVHE